MSNSIFSGHIDIKSNQNIIAKSYILNHRSLYLNDLCTLNVDTKYDEATEITVKYTLKDDGDTIILIYIYIN